MNLSKLIFYQTILKIIWTQKYEGHSVIMVMLTFVPDSFPHTDV